MLQTELKHLPPVNKNTVEPLPTYQLAIDNLPELIYWKNKNLVFLGCNLAFAKAVGLSSPEQIIGKTDDELPLSKNTLDFLGNQDCYVIENNTCFEHSCISGSISREQVWLHISKTPLINADSKVTGMLCRIEDISKHKLQEAELIQSQQRRLALMVQQTPLAVIEWNCDFEVKEWNQAAQKLFGYRKSEALGSHFGFLVEDDKKINLEKMLNQFINKKQRMVITSENITKHGQKIICEWYNYPLVAGNGEIIGIASMVLDITERKLAQEKLKQQELFLRTVYDGADNALIVIDVAEDGKFRYAGINSATEKDSGLSKEQVIGKTPEELFGEVEGSELSLNYRKSVETGKSLSFEKCFTFNNQKSYWLTTINPLTDNFGKIYRLIVTSLNITQRRQAEIQLHNSLKESADIKFALEQSAIVAITDKEGNIEYVNENFCKISQYTREELIGKNHRIVNSNYHPKSFFSQMWETISNGKVWRGEIKNRAKDGSLYWVDTTIVPMLEAQSQTQHYIAIRNDITARKKAETQVNQKAKDLEQALYKLQCAQTQLVQSEKMSALGQLVAGVAHEINNPVNFIYGNINHADNFAHDLLQILELYRQHYSKPPSEIRELEEELDFDFLVEDLPRILKSMKIGAQRIREIVTSLRNFSRMDEAKMKKVDIHEGIDSTLMILEHRIKAKSDRSRIEIIKNYGNFPEIECYAGQLNQVFMNILANAIDALEERMESSSNFDSPTICIKTELIESKQVKISIFDNGNGIPEDIKTRLFDPFFTTKPVGKGTGMGLSISYQIIVEKHCGCLNCISTPGEGTEFIISIPTQQCE